mgnify:CR=1 FL=1
MINLDEDALICDLAETYQIYDYRQLPATRVAVFAYGLRDDSRIKRKINGIETIDEQIMLASILDQVNMLVWLQTEDGHKGINRPGSVLEQLFGRGEKEKRSDEVVGYRSGEEFEKARQQLLASTQSK